MSKFISHANGERYSVINAAQILAFNVSFDDALQALLGAGVSGHDATSILDNPAPASEWFSTLLSALNYTVEDIGSVVDTLPDTEVTDNLEAKLLDVGEQVSALAEQFAAEQERAERNERIAQLEAAIDSALPELAAYLAANTIPAFDVNNRELVRQWALNHTEAGRQLTRLRRAS